MAWSFVVAASAGNDLFDVVFPRNARDGFLDGVARTLSLILAAVSRAALLAEEMLSRATWVIGAAFLGQVPLCHGERVFGGEAVFMLSCFCAAPTSFADDDNACDVLDDRSSAGDSFCLFDLRSTGAIGGHDQKHY